MNDSSKWFYFAEGKVAKNIDELDQIMHNLSDQEFSFHVNAGKNDFANWIEGVFNEKELADDLRRSFERKETHQALKNFLKEKHHENSQQHGQKDHHMPKEMEHKLNPMAHDHDQTENSFAQNDMSMMDSSKEILQITESDKEYTIQDFENPPKILVESSELNDSQLKDLADDAKHDLHIEGRMIKHDKTMEDLDKAHAQIDTTKPFIVKEFIYGFLIGLVFGCILLGILMQVNICY